ncbi:MAG TPA: universal stress protein [Actinomycetes bacterium]
MKEIVVGVDDSDASVDAVRFAGGLAARSDAALTLVHVRPAPPSWVEQRSPDEDEAETFLTAASRRRSRQALDGCGVSWSFEVRDGDPARQLEAVARERDADLVVVGACRPATRHVLRPRSVPNRLVHHADRPVLVVRSGRSQVREVVVGVDATPLDADTAWFAGRLAKAAAAHLTVVYVRHIPVGYAGPPIATPSHLERYYEKVEALVRRRVARVLAPLDMAWDFMVRAVGEPADELDQAAEEAGADVVVVGCHGRSALGRALVGSVSTELVQHANRPVLVVR